MYPIRLHFIKHASVSPSYLGTYASPKSKTIAFAKESQANAVKNYIQSDHVRLSTYSDCKYILENPVKNKKFIKRKDLVVESFNTDTGLYFCHVNNMELVLIDEVFRRGTLLELRSNFKLDHLQLLDMEYHDHLDKILEGDTIDYDIEYANMVINAYYADDEEDDYEE
jgi:hypothetical protein